MTIRRLFLYALLGTCLTPGIPAWAGALPPGAIQFAGNALTGQGLLNFDPTENEGNGVLTIGAGNGTLGGLITDLFSNTTPLICGGACTITAGYLTLTSGVETSGGPQGTGVLYTFGAGGTVSIFGGIPALGIPNGSALLTGTFLAGDTFMVTPAGLTATGTFLGMIDQTGILLNPLVGQYTFTSVSNLDTSMDLNLSCATLGNACSGSVDPIVQLQTPVPEPGALSLLFGAGLASFGAGPRRRRPTRLVGRPGTPKLGK